MDPLTMSSNTITFSSTDFFPIGLQDAINNNKFSNFPTPWAPYSADPGIRVVVTNNAQPGSATVAPVLVDRYTDGGATPPSVQRAIFAELSSVQPGQTVDETVQGIPVSQMYLVIWVLTFQNQPSFTVNVAAYRV